MSTSHNEFILGQWMSEKALDMTDWIHRLYYDVEMADRRTLQARKRQLYFERLNTKRR